jgi:DNA repair protein RecN (Recombination protein N)
MLTRLSISNYALIDEVNVSFDAALNIITGETGAGKSIMIGALGLITGNRADFSVLKNADKKCVVEAEFNLSALNLVKAFEAQDIDFDEHTIIRREVLPNGKSRAFVNDTPANLQQLKWLGEQLLDIHSQHQTQLLNTSEFQLSIVDTAAKTEKELTKYQKTFKEWSAAKSALEKLQNQEKDNKEDEEYLQFQLEELQKAKLDDFDITALEEEQQTLEKSEDIISALNEVNNALQESEFSVVEQLKLSVSKLNGVGNINTTLQEFGERAQSAYLELKDLALEIARHADQVHVNPERLQIVNEQLDLLFRLQQKHKTNDIQELIQFRDTLQEKLDVSASLEDLIEKAAANEKTSYQIMIEAAKGLHLKREKACEPIAKEVHSFLSQLGMENANLKVTLSKRKTPLLSGFNDIEMLFSANKGLSHQAIDKVASGGELSRVMLAFKAILAKQITMPSIIFDEIDTGVSGEVAFKMGKLLKEMGEDMQVISITHLPQIASRGNKHFKVIKDHSQAITQSKIITLTDEERVNEIAGMLSGNEITDHAVNNAKELLKNA